MTSDWPANLEIGHFELLLRIAVGMAKAEGDAAQRTKRLMLGVHFATSMWALSVRTLNLAAAEKVGGHACTAFVWRGAGLEPLACSACFAFVFLRLLGALFSHPSFLACC